ncbi:uncharacterized protein LOC134261046 [Saccostrea cucullata]|uniref:uncharacterized protein LOC134261046 n=1 Tax=Saccostrea cuccullata TaxID=36930 RepID=UPI002ED0D74F
MAEALKEIIDYGVSLGYKEDTLREFVRHQQDIQREERLAERERLKEELEYQRMKEKHDKQMQLQQLTHQQQMEMLHEKEKLKIAGVEEVSVKFKGPKIPAFEDGKDEMDSYLRRFERYAELQKWPKTSWAMSLSALLKGRALDIYALLPADDALDYDNLKIALLKRYELTEDGFKHKFRSAKPETGETFVQFSVRMSSYLLRWLKMAKIADTFEALFDLVLRDQFLNTCNRDLTLFLKERTPKSIQEMAQLADQYREARMTNAATLSNVKGNEFQHPVKFRSGSGNHKDFSGEKRIQNSNKAFVPKSERRCFKCNRIGHIASECRTKPKVGAVTTEEQNEGHNSSASTEEHAAKVTFVSTMPTDTGTNSMNLDASTRVSPSCYQLQHNMPVSAGFVEGKPVTVLRDTGCSGIVVRRSKIGEANLIQDKFQTCILADGSSIRVPVASIFVDTPYITGTFEAWCMEKPVYDLIIGNVAKVRAPGDPDPEWSEANAVETRQQAKVKLKQYPQLKVPEILKGNITPDEIKLEQQTDDSLQRMRQWASSGQVVDKRTATIRWFMLHGFVYREYQTKTESGKSYKQLVVPKKFREIVMKLAHESIMSGHLAISRTSSRILSEFYWPGLQTDVKLFCRSCDICQRTIQKGKVSKYPLQKMPLIDVPFKRVAVDIVGPMHPITDKGNRYILTLVDFATRYPEAVPLPSIETERVAEALIDIFSRIGVPEEMLSDMGSQFTSSIMREVSRLLSLNQLTTTPYHPMTNGLVERFNGTLKQMLKRMCSDRPRDWDKYINPVLFAYREVPQESLGFSPFDLVYGRHVRGPMGILKELWTKEIDDDQVKSTYQYVLDLRERLETTAEIARENLEKASQRQARFYNRSTRARSMKVGDKVLVLLPTDSNKLLMQWKGPFSIKKKLNKVDYQIEMKGKLKTFHVNMLKKYINRNDDSSESDQDDKALVTSAVIDCSAEEEDDEYGVVSARDTKGVDINPELSPEDRKKVTSLLDQFTDVLSDDPGYTQLIEHDIKINSSQPIRVKSYAIPFSMREIADKEVDKMLELNVIEPSESPFSSPVVLVKKKDDTFRFCVDFRAINACSQFDAEPMPNADDIFSKFANYKVFSRIDLSKGYWQVPLTSSAKPKTAFQTSKGLFQFRVMPFGLVTAPATFSRLMRKLLYGMSNIDNFIDDIIVFTEDLDQHLEVLHELFTRLRNANLTAKPSKCAVGYKSLECLGHIVGENQLKPNPDKVRAIQEAPAPSTKRQLRSFLGLLSFYRKFIPNFSSVALPLTDLTKKGSPNKIIWNQPQEKSFQTLKAMLLKSPILKLPDLSKQFILQADASDRGIGTVLMQFDEHSGLKLPVAYASRKLKDSESKYSTIEKECLAIVWAVQKFHLYLYGREFLIETDHQSLIYLNKAKVINARIMRWALGLQSYRYRVIAIRGRDNQGADYLSRQ